MDVVVIVAPTEGAAAENVDALAAACTAALTNGRCRVADDAADNPTVRATLTFGADDASARIVVRGPGGEAERTLRFGANDAAVERWRSSGLVIGTVAEGVREAPPPSPRQPGPKPPPSPVKPAPSPPPRPSEPPPVWIDAGLTVGPALEDGSARGGPVLRLGYGLGSLPIAVLVGATYSYRGPDERGVEVHTFAGGGGGAAVLRIDPVTLSARAELVAHLLAARADRGGKPGGGSRWLPGGRFGAEAAWMVHRSVGPWLGLDFTVVSRGTQLSIRGEPAGRAPPYEVSPQLGVRAAFP